MNRRTLFAVAGATTLAEGVASACTAPSSRAAPAARDLAAEVDAFTRALTSSGPYRPPTPAERDAVVPALRALAARADDAAARRTLAEHGFVVDLAVSGAGTRYVLAASDPRAERAWGLYAFPVGRPVRLLAEVPHPNFDLRTEKVGLNLLARAPGAALVEAGAHRRAAGSLADVAHQTSSLFHAFASDLAARTRVPQVQLHGFDDAHGPDHDVVLSPGSAALDPSLPAASAGLRRARFRVCQAWTDRCPNLEGRTNVQGRAARESGTAFLHVEMSDVVRGDRASRGQVARVLAEAVGSAAR